MPHRADVQGLRGVAVLAVLAVHAWPELLRGGFVGVDMFFVLSGWLITGLVLDEQAAGRFSLPGFYRRRALRLFPALCLVLAFCLVCAPFTFPAAARSVGGHVAAGAGFVSNLALLREAGYFDAASETKPLLHLWSLAIEEQFYLLWPLVLIALRRHGRWLFAVLAALALASFALNVALTAPGAKAAFFLLPTRAWELLLGAGLAVLKRRGSGWPALDAAAARFALRRGVPDALAAGGALLVAAAFALLDRGARFPGWWALLPTTGTLLLLAAGERAWLNRRVLAHPVAGFYGDISYALYLWHWPLLVFPQLWGWEMDHALRVLVLVASVAAAHLTTEWVERPLRRGAAHPALPWRLAGTLAGLGLLGALLFASDGAVGLYPKEVQTVARADLVHDDRGYRAHRCFLDLETGPGRYGAECWPGRAPRTLLWGDSHAASLYPGLARHEGADGIAQFTKAACPPLAPAPPGASRHCDEANAHVLAQVARQAPQAVVLAGHWSLYAQDADAVLALARSLRATVRALQDRGVQQVTVVGHLPTWNEPLPRLLLRHWSRDGALPERSHAGLDPRAAATYRLLARALQGSGVRFVSPMHSLCDATGCLVALHEDGVMLPLMSDRSHLTLEGSVAFVARAAGDLGLHGPARHRPVMRGG